MPTTNFSIRVDSDIKEQCEALYSELGLDLATAINVFLRQSIQAGGFPFDVQPNSATKAALLDADRIARDAPVKGYSDVDVALKVLKE